MVGGENRGVVLQDGRHHAVLLELLVQEPAHHMPVPAAGMGEAGIERRSPYRLVSGLKFRTYPIAA